MSTSQETVAVVEIIVDPNVHPLVRSDDILNEIVNTIVRIRCPYCDAGDTGLQRMMNCREYDEIGILDCSSWGHYYLYVNEHPMDTTSQ